GSSNATCASTILRNLFRWKYPTDGSEPLNCQTCSDIEPSRGGVCKHARRHRQQLPWSTRVFVPMCEGEQCEGCGSGHLDVGAPHWLHSLPFDQAQPTDQRLEPTVVDAAVDERDDIRERGPAARSSDRWILDGDAQRQRVAKWLAAFALLIFDLTTP